MNCNNSHPQGHWRTSLYLTALLCLVLAGCGGGGGSAGGDEPVAGPRPTLTNFQRIVVEAGPANGVNQVYTSVTVCLPDDSSDCLTVDNVLVDTGSSGLRLLASVVPPSFNLPQQPAPSGAALVECMQFADSYSWGPVKTADVRLGGETVPNLPLQIIGDADFPLVPSDCSSSGPSGNTVQEFGSNGILGIGNFLEDCGEGCVDNTFAGLYYACNSIGCAPTRIARNLQVAHPVAKLSRNNNGVLLRLPAVAAPGATRVAGTMIFGIGTESNNGLGAAQVYTVSPTSATLTVTANGTRYPNSFIDSGSNGLFFPSNTIPVCNSGFYCPSSPQNIAAVLEGNNGNSASVDFVITNADALFSNNPTYTAFPTLGAPFFNIGLVDLGLPFFFGRTVYTAIEGRNTPGGVGPYVAF